jgi:glutamate-1-semialdehyde 2,1-aminomutase
MNATLSAAIAEAEARYAAANPASALRHREAASALPGGNTRTVLHYSPFPLAWAKGDGSRLHDFDGHGYNDFLGEHSAALYGHSNPIIIGAIKQALDGGIVLGGPNRYEADFATELRRRFPSLELLRFCNSGTEANLFAIQTARAHTGRKTVMAFEGGYHGGVFYFRSGGMPLNFPGPWIIAPYNDAQAAIDLMRAHASDLAAVIVEPMLGGGGCIPADVEFLGALRQGCDETSAILIFDEVMTSRISIGGAQGLMRVKPDMTTLGKYLGGGMSFGAFGGRSDIMGHFDPSRPDSWPHAGTFNNNVLSMAAGLAGLQKVLDPDAIKSLNAKAGRLRDGIDNIAAQNDVALSATGIGSFVGLHFASSKPRRPQASDPSGHERRSDLQALMHLDLIAAGQYFGRRGFMALMLPTTEEQIDGLLAAIEEFVLSRRNLIQGKF